ncbi:MAG TPA: GNAT family N-acetyltransferase [Panacibacter sp.]|nr:GNAT family N-acetyltransferase [Panacibacter sp.]
MLSKFFSPFPILTTARLTLRQLSDADKQGILALRSDIHINKYLGRLPSETLDDAMKFINKVNENIKNDVSVYWAITITGNENIVGTICLFDFSNENDKCEIGYELLTEYQGQGIMQEATERIIKYGSEKIGLKKIEAFTHKDNQSSIKLLSKFNFIKSATPDQANKDFLTFSLTL